MLTRSVLMLGSMIFLLSVAATIGYATGTAAGTAITNQATVQYNAGSNLRTATSSPTTLYVAHKVSGSFAPASLTSSGVDNQTVYFPAIFRNTGNRADDFNVTFNANPGYTVAMYHDLDANGTVTAGDVLITSTGSLAPDTDYRVVVQVQIAAARPDNESVTITATMTSTAANDNTNHIFVANPGVTVVFDAHYTVSRPVLAFTASSTDVSPNANRIPGANITYTMTLQNTGSAGVVGNSTVTFLVDHNFHFVSASNSGTLGSPDGNGNGGTVTWTFPQASLAPASSNTFTVVVQPEHVTNNGTGVAAGTNVYAMTSAQSAQTKVDYNDGVNNYSLDNANSFTFAVGTASGVVITQVTADGSGEPGSIVEYHYTLKNTGNATDGFDFTQANDPSGNLDVAHIFSQSAGGALITSLAGVTQGATTDFYVRVSVPLAALNGETIKRTLTATTQTPSATSPVGGSTNSSDLLTTSALAATVTIAVADPVVVSGAMGGYAVPGTVLRYTITVSNTGAASATAVKAWDLNAHLTADQVVNTSVNIDANGDNTYEITGAPLPFDNGTVKATLTSGVVTTEFSSIPGGAYVRYQYDVTVQ